MQAAWHGLDLPLVTGAIAIVCALVVNTAFAFTARTIEPMQSNRTSVAFVSLAAAFFLELTLLSNVGRIGQVTGLSLLSSALLVQASCIAGLTLAALRPDRRISAALVVICVLLAIVSRGDSAVVMLFITNASVIAALSGAGARITTSATLAFTLGTMLQFALVFGFYSLYEVPALWAVAAVIIGAIAWRGEAVAVPRGFIPYTGAAALLALVAAFPLRIPARGESAGLRVLTYNIHQGYDAFGVPAMQRIADEIARFDADVVALQEVGRGWNFVGGADLIAYLGHRFPGYAVHFAPSNGQLWGVAILSRLPVQGVSSGVFTGELGDFRYGYVRARVLHDRRPIAVLSAHLSAGLEGNGAQERVDQMQQLLSVVAGDSTAIIAGDFNAWPDDAPIKMIRASGFQDAGAPAGISELQTWPAVNPSERIDYVFVRGNLKSERGEVRRTHASDHLPVFTVLR